jgi:uncharacterized membrane protein YgcG
MKPSFRKIIFVLGAAAAGFMFFFAFPAALHADERILSYHGDVTVRDNGDLVVEETIRVRAEGAQIRRGIYRDFPMRYRSRGFRYTVGMDVVEVLRDGETEPYHVKNMSNGKRIYIGRESVFLDPGEYTYTIRYVTSRQLGYFRDHDELYWNVTGNGWGFAIDRASVEVHVPQAAAGQIQETDAFTGPQGAVGKAFRSLQATESTVHFETTEILGPGEGLTVLVTWPKGLVHQPSRSERVFFQIKDNPGMAVGVAGLILVFAYYLYFWLKVGKDPARGTVFPQFKPPTDLSPAAVRYVMHMGYDNKVFSAAVVNMAVKGFLTIDQKGTDYTLRRATGNPESLTAEERKIADALFSGRIHIELKNSNHATIQTAVQQARKILETRFHKTYFFTNRLYFVPGLLLSLLALAASLFVQPQAEAVFLIVWLSIWTFGCTFLLVRVVHLWREAVAGGRVRAARLGAALFMTFFALPFLAGEFFAIFALSRMTSFPVYGVAIVLVALNAAFYRLLKAPTPQGRKAMDVLEGFRMYLSAAEAPRMKVLHPPERTPKLFEAYLPYALALDVEQQWAEQFTDVLARAGEGQGGYSPVWYHGSDWTGFNAGSFAESVGSSLSSAISSASTAPGSSSGSGGGGSSGGGGGGGGGGGW